MAKIVSEGANLHYLEADSMKLQVTNLDLGNDRSFIFLPENFKQLWGTGKNYHRCQSEIVYEMFPRIFHVLFV